MAGSTKKRRSEPIRYYYGINPRTFEVESITVSRDGTMTKGVHSHYILPGSRDLALSLVYEGLTDIIMITPAELQAEHTKKMITELREKAARTRAEHEANQTKQDSTPTSTED
jgi:hypothetical protein